MSHTHTHTHTHIYIYIQGVPGGMCQTSGEFPYVKVYRYNPKHLCPKLNGYGAFQTLSVDSYVGNSGLATHLTALHMQCRLWLLCEWLAV